MAISLEGKRIAFLATDGVEQSELEQPWNELMQAGAELELVSVHKGAIQAVRHMDKGDTFEVDRLVADADASDYDGLVLPGGVANPDTLRANRPEWRPRRRARKPHFAAHVRRWRDPRSASGRPLHGDLPDW